MKESYELLDTVALLVDVPAHGLRRGEVGTLVEYLAPDVWLVEFSDNSGEEYALAELHTSQLMKLYYEPGLSSATDKALAV
ncbi:MAG TPA: DUF4926 domain-containing protein [Chloroflexota bacterium]|nr:DUF4926 domain-containing protein [Chloroflexota bacterium]HUM68961.1 DUF4926 domain-containing protein [Chloroflexota bacterium]